MTTERFDYVIIGAGSAGLIAADLARRLGVRVALVERDRIGGDCTWTGCVPSKSLLHAAAVADTVRHGLTAAVAASDARIDMRGVRDYVQANVSAIGAGTSPDALRARGIDVILGAARFVDERTIALGARLVRGRRFLIATGADPIIPPIRGLADVPYLTYRGVYDVADQPRRLAVVGGGPIGVETAQSFARLGVEVTIVAAQLLAKEEPAAQAIVRDALAADGVRFIDAAADAVARDGDAIVVRSARGEVRVDRLFVAAGRRPALDDLDLACAGIERTSAGTLRVDDALRTTNRRVFAAGDVSADEQYSHLAGWQGFAATRNALIPGRVRARPAVVPRVTFCSPEVAQVGLTERQARAAGGTLDVREVPIAREDRAVCDNAERGCIKIVARGDRIVGATIVAERAGEAIAPLALAMQHGIGVRALAGSIHAYPTYGSGVQLVLSDMAMTRALRGVRGTIARRLIPLLLRTARK